MSLMSLTAAELGRKIKSGEVTLLCHFDGSSSYTW